MNNVFMENIKGIVMESYAGADKPKYDWQTAIDMFNAKEHITEGMAITEIVNQRSEFLEFVSTRKFDKDGNEI